MKISTKRLGLLVGVLFFLVIIGLIIEWNMTVNAGFARLAKVRAELDATEPGWQLNELNARRNAKLPPENQDIALIALKVIKKTPVEFEDYENKLEKDPPTVLKPNHFADAGFLEEFRKRFEPIKPLVVQLHEIRKYPTGGIVMVFTEPDVMLGSLEEPQKLRKAASKLSWQVMLSTQDNDPNTAIEACLTGIHFRHAIGDEPTLISQLIRMAIITVAINSTERTLGMTEPKQGLAELQADFEKALEEKDCILGIEGERAMYDRYYENFAYGLLRGKTNGPSNFIQQIFENRYVYDFHAQTLEWITYYRNATKLKGKERADAYKSAPIPKGNSLSKMPPYVFAPAWVNRFNTITRAEAKLGTIIAAIACERYRQANGKWPESLNDIPKEILKVIPIDSYVGGPVKYKKTATGVVIYSTGEDEVDDGGVTLDAMGTKPKSDIGIQLFDPAQRRLPAEVKPKVFDDAPPPLPEPEKP